MKIKIKVEPHQQFSETQVCQMIHQILLDAGFHQIASFQVGFEHGPHSPITEDLTVETVETDQEAYDRSISEQMEREFTAQTGIPLGDGDGKEEDLEYTLPGTTQDAPFVSIDEWAEMDEWFSLDVEDEEDRKR